MALGGGSQYGIVLRITPSTGSWKLEIQRSSGTVGSTAWVEIANVNTDGTVVDYSDALPDDNGIRNYRCRHNKTGYTAGSWTTRVSARPTQLYGFPGF